MKKSPLDDIKKEILGKSPAEELLAPSKAMKAAEEEFRSEEEFRRKLTESVRNNEKAKRK